MQFSSGPVGNFTMNFEPAFSSESLRGRKRHTTLILSSAAISLSAAMTAVLDNRERLRIARWRYHWVKGNTRVGGVCRYNTTYSYRSVFSRAFFALLAFTHHYGVSASGWNQNERRRWIVYDGNTQTIGRPKTTTRAAVLSALTKRRIRTERRHTAAWITRVVRAA